jgi:precorrin-6A/cobalt-precorrin-6A reductase
VTVLVLAGTAEAGELAAALHARGLDAITSFAGRVPALRLPPGRNRVGGFGGAEGLERYLAEQAIDAVIDATHPFAAQMSANAAAACPRAGVALLRLERRGWASTPEDRWHRVADVDGAASMLRGDERVLLALGRQQIGAFAGSDAFFVIRAITSPAGPLPARRTILLARGPFAVEDELALLDAHAIDLVITRDSGGAMTAPKLVAARRRGLPVVVVDRPAAPPGVATTSSVDGALRWLSEGAGQDRFAGAFRRPPPCGM